MSFALLMVLNLVFGPVLGLRLTSAQTVPRPAKAVSMRFPGEEALKYAVQG
jgi:hypothetical protein